MAGATFQAIADALARKETYGAALGNWILRLSALAWTGEPMFRSEVCLGRRRVQLATQSSVMAGVAPGMVAWNRQSG